MQRRWLVLLGCFLATIDSARAQTPAVPHEGIRTVGHLLTDNASADVMRAHAQPYRPQPGDIALYDDFNPLFHFIFKLAKTSPPTHAAMVIAGADGKPALLELTGPKVLTSRVLIMDVDARFSSYPGIVMVRKIRQPLTEEQSRDLTQFAQAQAGKPFAWPRVALQATPFCPRFGLRKELFGHTYLNRDRWYCSELVVAGCATAKILDGKSCCANATYPRDLAVDQVLDLSAKYHPPARWVSDAER